jgi:RNA polymerase sigma-70 factor (ECF subfamily)
VTDPACSVHSLTMVGVVPAGIEQAEADGKVEDLTFTSVYDRYFSYIWRSVQCLGVPASQADDVVQEVFVIAHDKLPGFEGRSSLKTWLYGIAVHRARHHRKRAQQRAGDKDVDAETLRAPDGTRPDHRVENAEAVQVLSAILSSLDDDQREVFVLAELEELSAPEIAAALGIKLNTVYSRLRLGREAFAKAAARHRARDGWRTR